MWECGKGPERDAPPAPPQPSAPWQPQPRVAAWTAPTKSQRSIPIIAFSGGAAAAPSRQLSSTALLATGGARGCKMIRGHRSGTEAGDPHNTEGDTIDHRCCTHHPCQVKNRRPEEDQGSPGSFLNLKMLQVWSKIQTTN